MKLTVYSRAYCHLCDDMVAALAALRAEHGFELEVIDIDADPVLEARYNEMVPVLECDGVEVCHHFLDHARLIQVLGSSPAIC